MDLILTREHAAQLEEILREELLDRGADHAFVADSSGNLIIEAGKLSLTDILPLAALAAANFGATENIANLVGAGDFSLVFHKGEKHNIHSGRIDKDFILVVLFGSEVSLGLVRLGSTRVAERVLPILRS
jgi:predicted regulator of Ras-like GTPase activity (Roadblock/LC7/MglB family)